MAERKKGREGREGREKANLRWEDGELRRGGVERCRCRRSGGERMQWLVGFEWSRLSGEPAAKSLGKLFQLFGGVGLMISLELMEGSLQFLACISTVDVCVGTASRDSARVVGLTEFVVKLPRSALDDSIFQLLRVDKRHIVNLG